MKVTKYRELTIEHPLVITEEIMNLCDFQSSTFLIRELDVEANTLEGAKEMIDHMYIEMDLFNQDNPDDTVESIHEYIEQIYYAKG